MSNFQYKAKTQTGELVSGTLAAGDRRMALAQLGRMGYYPLVVNSLEAKESSDQKKITLPGRGQRVSPRDVLMFTRQLSSLLHSGMKLSRALESLRRRTQKRGFSNILTQLHEDIVQRQSLSDALAKHPKAFSKFYVNLVKAGEASGALDEVLVRLANHYERMNEVRETVVSALIYPLIIVCVGILTIIFFMTVMVPRFAQMFAEMGRTMPLPTRILIGTSGLVTKYWWIGGLILLAGVLIYRQRARTTEGRLAIDGMKLRMPLLGRVLMASAFSQFARTLATLLENGVPVLNSLQIVEDTMTNSVIANELAQARSRVTDGTSISQPLAKGKIFPPLLIDMLAVGEESGSVVPSLKNIADSYEQELSHTLKVFTSLLSPLIIIFMAVMVGGIVVSVLMAVFDITSGIGK